MMEKKRTAGQISMDLIAQEPDVSTSSSAIDEVREIRKKALDDYEKKVRATIDTGLKRRDGDFFIDVEVKQERLMKNFIISKITDRDSCGTPHYGQNMYKYHRSSDTLEFLWAVPQRDWCIYAHQYPLEVPEYFHDLRTEVLDFYDDTFLRRCKKLNKETVETKGFYD